MADTSDISEAYKIVYEKDGISAEDLGNGIYILRCALGDQKQFWQKRLLWSYVIVVRVPLHMLSVLYRLNRLPRHKCEKRMKLWYL